MPRVFISLYLLFNCACVACGDGKKENSQGITGTSGAAGGSPDNTNITLAGNGGPRIAAAGEGNSTETATNGGTSEVVADNVEGASPPSPTISSEVKEYISELVDNANIPGIVVALITSDGVTYHSYGKTAVNGGPVDEHTIFEIGSTTKTFTSILLSDMVEQGKMALNDPVQRYLPPDVAMPSGDAITLEHLATHCSGLPRDTYVVTEYNLNAGFTPEQLYDLLPNYTLIGEPGVLSGYSNLAFGLLGHVLSLATDMSYEELVMSRISMPLEMNDTRIMYSEEEQRRFATPHRSDGKVSEREHFGIMAGCGGLRSTAVDGARFIQANLDLYETELYPSMQRTHEKRVKFQDRNSHIGLGWIVDTLPGVEIVWHNGGTAGFHSYFGFIRSQKVGVVVLSNSNYNVDSLGKHILFASEYELPPIKKTVPVAIEVLESYVGTYQLAPSLMIEVILEGETLMIGITGLPALPPIKVPALPESEVDFFTKEHVEAEMTFEKDDTGKVVAIHVRSLPILDQRAEKIL